MKWIKPIVRVLVCLSILALGGAALAGCGDHDHGGHHGPHHMAPQVLPR